MLIYNINKKDKDSYYDMIVKLSYKKDKGFSNKLSELKDSINSNIMMVIDSDGFISNRFLSETFIPFSNLIDVYEYFNKPIVSLTNLANSFKNIDSDEQIKKLNHLKHIITQHINIQGALIEAADFEITMYTFIQESGKDVETIETKFKLKDLLDPYEEELNDNPDAIGFKQQTLLYEIHKEFLESDIVKMDYDSMEKKYIMNSNVRISDLIIVRPTKKVEPNIVKYKAFSEGINIDSLALKSIFYENYDNEIFMFYSNKPEKFSIIENYIRNSFSDYSTDIGDWHAIKELDFTKMLNINKSTNGD